MWQQDLLVCNTITMIDATYKTTKYDLPLFFVCIKTNHGYCVVAEFISQNECATAIQEPLEVLKTWNPQWQPEFFMCDCTARQRLLPLKHHSQALLYTFAIFTENRLGKDGSRTTNMVSPLQMQMFSLIFEHVRGLHLQLPMRMA